ncbi:MAG TPA: hypothetical protein DIW81_19720 [Planctomycetaceae bacterium]|uniref:helix-turn-helix domain-containing protein n=1 Tax=Rubinisphaera sp. TaxID=2024857 RepID=UPI000C0C8490|nr:hypothetical protein [Rubinisphaera sp.]HCS53785.1 hypothetical protein [Planctomycetaceae bacterium]
MFLSPSQVAEYLSVCPRTVRELIVSGELTGVRIRGQYRIDSEELQNYIKQQTITK